MKLLFMKLINEKELLYVTQLQLRMNEFVSNVSKKCFFFHKTMFIYLNWPTFIFTQNEIAFVLFVVVIEA